MLTELWNGLDRRRRIGFAACATILVVAVAVLAWWTLRGEDEVLFSGLAPQDAAAMTAELDRMKLPYRIGGDGTTLLVDRSAVHATRLKLMGREMPLHGAVGFELFNGTDFGMTEFAQKINYQRALQGELTRTILSLSEVESARVHLALPEESLFRRETARAKAAVTLSLKRGQSLRADQVAGIQRLVAASVNGIAPDDVTIVDRQGVALTRVARADAGVDARPGVELKAEVERLLAQKITTLLERAFGPGRAVASVDVVLDLNQVKVTTEDVRGQAAKEGETPTGVVVRERETVREDGNVASSRDASAGTSYRETDYQVGRRVEQVVRQAGAIQRLQAVVLVKDRLDGEQLGRIRAMVAAAAGADAERGDTVVVESAAGLASGDDATATSDAAAVQDAPAGVPDVGKTTSRLGWGVAAAVAMVALAFVVVLSSRRGTPRALTADERRATLDRVRHWMQEDDTTAVPVRGRSP